MKMNNMVDIFKRELECDYRGEHYSVRDNGAVKRHQREGKKKRELDDVWTFGTIDSQKGYRVIRNEAVHRIVATAFLGEAPTPQHVVDHIDTNRQNNRPENLRWVTKLENAMLNDVTRAKLEAICGLSIEEIVKDWSILQNKNLPPNIAWMKTLTKEEAINSYNNTKKRADSLSERIKNDNDNNLYFKYRRGPQAMIYPLEPIGGSASLNEYAENLKINKTFCYRNYRTGTILFKIIDYCYNIETGILSVATKGESGVKSLFITTVKIENNDFSYSTRSFFAYDGIEKYMTLARGKEWNGGEVFDDYC